MGLHILAMEPWQQHLFVGSRGNGEAEAQISLVMETPIETVTFTVMPYVPPGAR